MIVKAEGPSDRAKRAPLRDVVTIRQRHQRLGQIALLDSDDYRADAATVLADRWDGRSTAYHQNKLIKSIFRDFSIMALEFRPPGNAHVLFSGISIGARGTPRSLPNGPVS